MFETVRVEHQDALAVLTLHRPDALNALNSPLRRDLLAAITAQHGDDTVRAIVVTGAGRAFCAGVDLKEAQAVQVEQVAGWYGQLRDVYQAIRLLDKPIVAAVNGVAAGGGFQIALACDLRVGQAGTRMGQPEINAGIPSIMGSFWMSLHLGLALNQELSLTGRLMDADECRRVGLLNRLVAETDLLPTALELARELAAKPPVAMARTKQRFRELTQAAFDDTARAAIAGQEAAYRAGEPQAVMARFIAEREARRKP
ncbi:MAG TPA: enoyl-CoA hydratase/isomerase family protein [bacterium]|nr:enoyl-CoA hydratase/isomerase family protein [bacterium]